MSLFRAIFATFVLLCGSVFAAEEFDASVDRNAPDFIRASILIAGPAESLYGSAGHAAIRLQCAHYSLDEVFSYESEKISDRIVTFFMGRLKMGMFAVPFVEYIADYEKEGRFVREYPLALSPQAKVRLWKLLDDRVAEGTDIPYDYVRKGCAQAVLKNLIAAVALEPIVATELPEKFKGTRHELLSAAIGDFPWKLALIYMITGPQADKMITTTDSVIIPKDLVEYLGHVSINGRPILAKPSPIEIIPQTLTFSNYGKVISPIVVACVLLLLAVIGRFWAKRTIFALFAALYVALAVFETYVGVFSTLPAAAWNVLLIPFNPLPILLWKWRKYWAKPFAALLVGWAAWVVLAAHLPTDPAFAVLALAYAVIFLI